MGKKTITARPVIVRSNTSLIINQLNYTYYSDSNKLKAVTDAVKDNNSTLGDFKFTKKTSNPSYTSAENRSEWIEKLTNNILQLPI
jgi:hypothetical protein